MSMRDFIVHALEFQLERRPPKAGWRRLAGRAQNLDTAPVKRALALEFSSIDEQT